MSSNSNGRRQQGKTKDSRQRNRNARNGKKIADKLSVDANIISDVRENYSKLNRKFVELPKFNGTELAAAIQTLRKIEKNQYVHVDTEFNSKERGLVNECFISEVGLKKYVKAQKVLDKQEENCNLEIEENYYQSLKHNRYDADSTVHDGLTERIDAYMEKMLAKINKQYAIKEQYLRVEKKKLNEKWHQILGTSPKDITDKKILYPYNDEWRAIQNCSQFKHCPPKNFASPEYLKDLIRHVSLKDTILFSIDLEASEKNNDIITEIGISIYDPRENSDNVCPIFRNFHLIVLESYDIKNHEWVCDNKFNYQLGKSLILPLIKCSTTIQKLINSYMFPSTNQEDTWQRAFVGHNVQGDLNWLEKLGVKLPPDSSYNTPTHHTKSSKKEKIHRSSKAEMSSNSSKLRYINNTAKGTIRCYDTEKMYKIFYGEHGSSLSRILSLFNIPFAGLHNAGNDAYYTLQLLLRLGDFRYREKECLDDFTEMAERIEKNLKDHFPTLPPDYFDSMISHLSLLKTLQIEDKFGYEAYDNALTNGDRKLKEIINRSKKHNGKISSSKSPHYLDE